MKTLTPQQFNEATKSLNISDENREMARLVLVDGHRPSDVASSHNTPRSRISRATARILDNYKRLHGIPSTWVHVSVFLPASDAKAVEELEKLKITKLNNQK